MDTPARLKSSVIPGDVWEVFAHPLEAGLAALEGVDGVLRVGLTGDHLRVITRPGLDLNRLKESLPVLEHTERGEPTLEDVFLSLAKSI
jgi:hypothetical protein